MSSDKLMCRWLGRFGIAVLSCLVPFYLSWANDAGDKLKYAIHQNPQNVIKTLRNLPQRNLAQNFQLMILWQICQPDIVLGDEYHEAAERAHQDILKYFEAKKWQSSWRQEEYAGLVKDDYLACYRDLKCLLDVVPYYGDWDEGMEVYIPCETAQKYNKVVYFDEAGGGHGSSSFLISDCDLDKKYKYPPVLEDYANMLFQERLPHSGGSGRFYIYAKAAYESFINQYQPNFEMEKQVDNTAFPYTEWAVRSYYNLQKFNEVLAYGIGYQNAVEALTEHYVKTFGVSYAKAKNAALYALKLPSADDWQPIDSDNLYYMLLTGAEWPAILDKHPEPENYQRLLEYTIAYPRTLAKIITRGKQENDFNIDQGNAFGKTPLMLAAQYGYLESVKLLLENGANINAQTNDTDCRNEYDDQCIRNGKRSALMYAAQEGQYAVVKYLLEQGADVLLKDSEGNTAYQYMLDLAPYYNPHKRSTITGGEPVSRRDDGRPAFSPEQIQELTPLLRPGV